MDDDATRPTTRQGLSRRVRAAVAIGSKVGLDRILGVQPRVEGLDRLPTGGSILAFNHLSPVDPFLLAWLLADAGHDRPVVLTHRDIPRIPVIGRLLEAGAVTLQDDTPDDSGDPDGASASGDQHSPAPSDPAAVSDMHGGDASNPAAPGSGTGATDPLEQPPAAVPRTVPGARAQPPANSLHLADHHTPSDAFLQACEHLAGGRTVLVAPERGISPSLELMPLRSGAARLALHTGAPLVPVGLFGTHRLFDGDQYAPQRGVPVSVSFGYPVMTSKTARGMTKLLRLDMEALLERALDDYADRELGESGTPWWPARRGGGAPSFGAVVDQRAAGPPVVEATDDDPIGAEIWAEDMSVGTMDPVEEPVEEPREPDRRHDAPIVSLTQDQIAELYPRSFHRNAAQAGGYLTDLKAVLAFDVFGQPHEHHQGVHLDHHLDGKLTVHTDRHRVLLSDVDLSSTATRVIVYGQLHAAHVVHTPTGSVIVPPGTLVTLLGVPDASPSPAPIKDWRYVQGLFGRT